MLGDLRQLPAQCLQNPIALSLNRFRVRLVVDRVQQGLHPRPGRLWSVGHQIHRVVGAAALQGRTQQRRTDRRDQPSVGIRGDQLHPGQPAGHQVAERQQPAGPSSVVTVMPRTSRKPSALTPVACGPRGLGTRGHCPCTDVGKYQHNILLAALAVTAAPLAVTALGFALRERCPGYRKAA